MANPLTAARSLTAERDENRRLQRIVDDTTSSAQNFATVPSTSPPTGFYHVQSAASTTWTINHNLARNVATDVFTIGGVKIIAEVVNINTNQTQVLLDAAAAGYAVLN